MKPGYNFRLSPFTSKKESGTFHPLSSRFIFSSLLDF